MTRCCADRADGRQLAGSDASRSTLSFLLPVPLQSGYLCSSCCFCCCDAPLAHIAKEGHSSRAPERLPPHSKPSPHLLEYNDPAQELPLPADMLPERFADFSDRRSDKRDLGRNGSFLVIRELQQDVEGFWENARVKAEKVAEERPDLGGDIDADWIAAKIIGRWKSGAPLVREPKRSDVESDENDFLYGRDDAQGLRCPHGSHIRRSNPRESFNPGSQASLDIANRHRILRRGRPYIRDEGGEDEEKGLLFCCFNANIERQFEFVQQSWVNAPTFHGLRREPDPLMDPVGKGSFTIPTSNGPIQLNDMQTYVTMKGGGYFFMPGRATLRYLGI